MKSIWTRAVTTESLSLLHRDTAVSLLGIEFIEVGIDFLRARVPVDSRTRQPRGILHGGVSVTLAETIGSCGAAFSCAPGHHAVGLDINANHIRSASNGWVSGVGRPLHIGRTTQVWQIEMTNDEGKLTCVSRITMAILKSAD